MATKKPLSLTSEQSTEDSGKICFICLGCPNDLPGDDSFSFGAEPWDIDYSLFLLDLDADEWDRGDSSSSSSIPVNPNMCFSSVRIGVRGFGVLGSTLYLFGEKTREVLSYQLSSLSSVPSLSSPPIELNDRGMLGKVASMGSPKYDPVGFPTPDGAQMLVLSTTYFLPLLLDHGNFESFDGKDWTMLPDMHPLLRRSWADMRRPRHCTSVHLQSYSFIDNGPVLLITTQVGNFTFDTSNTYKGWSRYCKDGLQVPYTDYGVPMLVKGRLHFTDWFRWVDETEQTLSSHGLYGDGGGIAWLSPLMNRYCVVRSHFDYETMQPHLVIDVCDFDSDEPKVTKTIKLVVGRQLEPLFSPRCLFSIP